MTEVRTEEIKSIFYVLHIVLLYFNLPVDILEFKNSFLNVYSQAQRVLLHYCYDQKCT